MSHVGRSESISDESHGQIQSRHFYRILKIVQQVSLPYSQNVQPEGDNLQSGKALLCGERTCA